MPLPAPVEPQPVSMAPAPVPGVSDGVMLQLVDKLSTLVEQMQKFLDRPAQVIYQTGGGGRGEGGGRGGKRASSRNISDAQNSTLKDIFLNNLDLRKSLKKLAETVTAETVTAEAAPANGTSALGLDGAPVMDGVASDSHGADEEPPSPPSGVAPLDVESSAAEADGFAEPAHDDAGHEISMHVHEDEHDRHAQPAA